mmetsp:Transcript_29534/g.89369  ORF Transcript_29534/g.89369 Transcript_29534/m.89369 type:complete len:349 (-) Transcript_29534:1434-2480(-)
MSDIPVSLDILKTAWAARHGSMAADEKNTVLGLFSASFAGSRSKPCSSTCIRNTWMSSKASSSVKTEKGMCMMMQSGFSTNALTRFSRALSESDRRTNQKASSSIRSRTLWRIRLTLGPSAAAAAARNWLTMAWEHPQRSQIRKMRLMPPAFSKVWSKMMFSKMDSSMASTPWLKCKMRTFGGMHTVPCPGLGSSTPPSSFRNVDLPERGPPVMAYTRPCSKRCDKHCRAGRLNWSYWKVKLHISMSSASMANKLLRGRAVLRILTRRSWPWVSLVSLAVFRSTKSVGKLRYMHNFLNAPNVFWMQTNCTKIVCNSFPTCWKARRVARKVPAVTRPPNSSTCCEPTAM